MIEAIFEVLPILLAVVAAITCASRYQLERRKSTKTLMLLGIASAVMLIIAQTSWWSSYIVQGLGIGTWFADRIWAIFNCTTMAAFIIASEPAFLFKK